jgi:3-oxocholest-4-en-26-oate---CoA ligase
VRLHLASAWETVSDVCPEADAVVQGDRRLTYREFDEQAARFASALTAAGLGPGAKVALYLFNSPEYLVAQYGAFKAGMVAVNVNYRYLDDELAYLLADSDSEALVFHRSLGERVARVADRVAGLRLLAEVDDAGAGGLVAGAVGWEDLLGRHRPAARIERDGDDVYMLYTGGTTGMPKGVMYRHHDFAAGLYRNAALSVVGVAAPTSLEEIPGFLPARAGRGLVSIPCSPLMHGTGMWGGTMVVLLAGGTVVLLEGRTFDAVELWQVAERERATRIVIVGDAFARPMVQALERLEADGVAYDLSSVEAIASSGTIWSAEVKDGLTSRLDAVLLDTLGSTEGGGYALATTSRAGSVGTARFSLLAGTRVLAEDGGEVAPGSAEPGLLATPTGAFGYYKDPDKTARTFRKINGQGYVVTGDWATVDADGTVRLLGRGSNCINSGGEKIYPEEVEEALKGHAGVDDCLVVGLPHERFGQQVVAVAGSARPTPPGGDELRSWVRSCLSGYKVPKLVVVVDSVQRAPNGKADYDWAKTVATAALADGEVTA